MDVAACTIFMEMNFEPQSAEIEPRKMEGFVRLAEDVREKNRRIGQKCLGLLVFGSADKAEMAAPGDRMDITRGEALKKILLEKGGLSTELVEVRGMGTPIKSDDPELQKLNRAVSVSTKAAPGRWHCDPSSSPMICPPNRYSACYLELTDGALCNVYDVPDPNPKRYSVIVDDFIP
jgi:hypothetical protein